MEKITFKSNKERDRALSFIIGKKPIKVISDKTFGVPNGTAQELKQGHDVTFKTVKKANSSKHR